MRRRLAALFAIPLFLLSACNMEGDDDDRDDDDSFQEERDDEEDDD